MPPHPEKRSYVMIVRLSPDKSREESLADLRQFAVESESAPNATHDVTVIDDVPEDLLVNEARVLFSPKPAKPTIRDRNRYRQRHRT